MRKICVVTGTRAEYGLLRWVMEGIRNSSELNLQVIATGMHLSPEFGLTYREIEKDVFLPPVRDNDLEDVPPAGHRSLRGGDRQCHSPKRCTMGGSTNAVTSPESPIASPEKAPATAPTEAKQ